MMCNSQPSFRLVILAAGTTIIMSAVSLAFQPPSAPLVRVRPSPSRLSMTVEIEGMLGQVDTFWQTCPYTAAALVCGVKASAADMIAQHSALAESLDITEVDSDPSPHSVLSSSSSGSAAAVLLEEPSSTGTTTAAALLPDNLDIKRNVAFVLYGSLYQGMVHEYVFNHLYPAWFGTGMELQIVLTKVAFNLVIQTTLVTLPVAYVLKALVMNDNHHNHDTTDKNSLDTLLLQPLQSAFDKYLHDIEHQNLLGKCFGLWGPVQCLTFSIVPEHYRVTFIAVVSFFWLIILSQISSSQQGEAMATAEKE